VTPLSLVPKALTQQPLEDALHLLGPADHVFPTDKIPNLPAAKGDTMPRW